MRPFLHRNPTWGAVPPPRRAYIPAPMPDHLSFVGFANNGFLIAAPTPVTSPELEGLCRKLPGMMPSGGTNIADGLRKAIAAVQMGPRGTYRRIWLLSDGQPTAEKDAIIPVALEARRARINVNTVGIGDDFDEALLRQISGATHNGQFVSVNTLRQLSRAFMSASNGFRSPHRRAETTVFAVDMSSSMCWMMDGRRKIDVVEEAIIHLIRHKRNLFS
jgi:Mg-chelatase subunit ChlD